MHRAPGPWNTGVSHGNSTESPASLSLLSYKGLKRVPEGLSRGTHCCSQGRDHAESQCVWHGQLGVLDATTGTLCMTWGQSVILLPPWAVVRAVLARLQNRGYRNGQAPLPLRMKPPCAPGHLPALGEGSPCLAAENSSPTRELSSHPACAE